MPRLTPLVVAALLALTAAQTSPISQLGDVDMDALLADAGSLEAAIQCLLAESDSFCSSDAKIVRRLSLETLKTDCADCTEAQKASSTKFMAYVSKYKPEYVPKLNSKHDPTGEYRAKHADSFKARGINI